MSYWQKWQRGFLIILAVGLAGIAAALAVGLPAAAILLLLELVLHRPDWSALEGTYFTWAAMVGAIAIAPVFLSDMSANGRFDQNWTSKP